MNRRAAIAALAAAVPGLMLAADRPFLPPSSTDTQRPPNGLGFSTAGDLALRFEPPRYAAIFRPDGCVEITLDGWTGWRVTFAGESIDITPAEIMAALRGAKP